MRKPNCVLPAENEAVRVTLLGGRPAKAEAHVAGQENDRLQLRLDRALPAGSTVKLEWENCMLLAEVVVCRREGESYTAWLDVEHALFNTSELAQLAERVYHWAR
jgi:hypothetical protein